MDNFNSESKKSLTEIIKQKEKNDRMLLKIEVVLIVFSTLILLFSILLSGFLPVREWQKVLIALLGFSLAITGLGFSLKIEQMAGYYECTLCKHKYVPAFKAVVFSAHMGRTRYLKCPECGKKSWQKKVIVKE